MQMPERTVKIASTSGLHARPAAIFSQAASEQSAEVSIEKAGAAAVKASSILMLLTLNADHGDEVTLRAEGEGAEESLDALAALLTKNLDENL
ncbi:HPr family phosphocarrier protein [Brachybacterium sacelli]